MTESEAAVVSRIKSSDGPPQPQRLCADPGESLDGAAATNLAALRSLRDAIVEMRLDVAAPLDKDTVLHASMRHYVDETLQETSHNVGGTGTFGKLLAYIKDTFASVALATDEGLSQGHTTTFRGRARIELQGHVYAYLCRCGFRASGDRVAECWFELAPPPTLRELFE